MQVLSREEDFLLFCQLPGVGDGWLQIVGLILDVAGVMLLWIGSNRMARLSERADRYETRAEIYEYQHAKEERLLEVSRGSARQSKWAFKRWRNNRELASMARVAGYSIEGRFAFWGLVALLAGFGLQLIGSWPCSCP